MVTFSNLPLLWVTKLHTEISLSTIYSECVALYRYVRELLPLRSLVKEAIENLVIDKDKLEFV